MEYTNQKALEIVEKVVENALKDSKFKTFWTRKMKTFKKHLEKSVIIEDKFVLTGSAIHLNFANDLATTRVETLLRTLEGTLYKKASAVADEMISKKLLDNMEQYENLKKQAAEVVNAINYLKTL